MHEKDDDEVDEDDFGGDGGDMLLEVLIKFMSGSRWEVDQSLR